MSNNSQTLQYSLEMRIPQNDCGQLWCPHLQMSMLFFQRFWNVFLLQEEKPEGEKVWVVLVQDLDV